MGDITENDNDRQFVLCVLPWPEKATGNALKEIKEEFPNVDIHYIHDKHEREQDKNQVPEDLYKRADVLATLAWLPPSASAVPKLNLIQFFSAGTNHITNSKIYTGSDIPLTTASGIHGPQIAEWVVMMDLVNSHKFTTMYESQKKKEWNNDGSLRLIRDAVGKRVGVLGYGSIGRQVARVAKALGSDVIAYTASPRKTPESKKDNGFIVPGTGDPDGSLPSEWYSGLDKKGLHEFLRQKIDLLVLSVPLTPGTHHFLSAEEFEILHKSNPNGTFIANISRGGIIDQPALIKALEMQQIRGAALDVTDPEPLPSDDPLWSAPNVLITPHVSGGSVEYVPRAFEVLKENLRRRRDGGKLVNEVDRKRGY